PLAIQSVAITGPGVGGFAIIEGGGSGSLAPGESRTIRITFSPNAAGPFSASLTVGDNAAGSPHSVSLSGNGTNPPPPTVPGVVVAPGGSVSFTDQLVGTASDLIAVTITSNGTAPLKIDSISITGPDAASF